MWWLPGCALMSLSQCLLSYLEHDKYKTFPWHCYKSHFIDASQYGLAAAVRWCLFALEAAVLYKYSSVRLSGDTGKDFSWGAQEALACTWRRRTLPAAFHINRFLKGARLLLIPGINFVWSEDFLPSSCTRQKLLGCLQQVGLWFSLPVAKLGISALLC